MARPSRVVLSSAAVLLGLLAVFLALAAATARTSYGQERVRAFLSAWLSSRVEGTMYVGRIRGGYLDGVTVDSLEIRDSDGELFLASGPVTVKYDLRDLFDKRLLLEYVTLRNVHVQIRRYPDGQWNFQRIFPRGQPQPIGRQRGFADFIVIDSALVENGRFVLIEPWNPPSGADTGEARRRLAEALADEYGRVRRTTYGPAKELRWENMHARFGHTRLAHPDTIGRVTTIRDLAVKVHYPPLEFSELRAELRQRGDSLWLDVPHWRLPESSGRGRGTVAWGARGTRWDINVQSEDVALADVAWVHETFPRSGGGRMTLNIRNAAADPSVIEFAVSDMDVTAHSSRVLGRMVIDPHEDLVAFRDVSLRFAPLSFDLLRVFNGEPFPYDWRGTFSGTVQASGGRVDRFRIDRADLTYADAHVPGALSSFVASGVVDVSTPALATFHGMRLDVGRLDLRTPRAVFAEFPRLNGHVSGSAVLDSLWLDVRFRDADVTHHDGDGPVSRFTGDGRVTSEGPYLTYDAHLFAHQLSLTTFGRSYPTLPVQGEFSGPLRVHGQSPSLAVSTTLRGAAGSFTFDGTVDAEDPELGASGRGTFAQLDLQRFLRSAGAAPPRTVLSGRYEVDISGADLSSTTGRYVVELDSSRVGGTAIGAALIRGELAEGLVTLDTMTLASSAATAQGAGTVSLSHARRGSLSLHANVSSLAGLARALTPAGDSVPPLRGALTFTGEFRSGDELTVSGEIAGRDLASGREQVRALRGFVELTRINGSLGGAFSLVADTMELGPVHVSRAQVTGRVPADSGEGVFAAVLEQGDALTTFGGTVHRVPGAATVQLDSLVARIDSAHVYRAAQPSTIVLREGVVTLDSLLVSTQNGGGSFALRDLLWSSDSVRGSIRSREANLGLLSGVVPRVLHASGPLSLELDISGSRAKPRARGTLRLQNGTLLTTSGRYERLNADVALDTALLHIRQLSAETQRGGGRRGTASVQGTVDLSDITDPVFSVEARARSFRALSSRGVAVLDVSTGPSVSLTGPYSAAMLRGSLVVDEGTIYLPERLDKNITDLDDPELLALVDTVAAERRRFLPSGPTAFASNLTVDDVNIVIGDDVWLRSSEANVELGGSLRVTRTPTTELERAQLALVGNLNATRGTYVLNLAVVQPTFQVERGTLRFFGTPEVNPTLDIRAIHTVRQPRRTLAREDVRILVEITGTLRNPELALSSADGLPLSQSDLLSYLVTGEPSFALTGTSTEYAEQILTLGGRLAGTLLSARIPRSLFDIVEVRTGAVRLESGIGGPNPYLNTLYNTRIILGKQMGDRWYVGLSTGFCRENFAENLGLRLEYRLGRTYFAQGGIEPGSGDLACVGPSAARTFQQTPPQLGLDLFRSWRF